MRAYTKIAALLIAGITAGITAVSPVPALAQNLFAPVATVDETVVTRYEVRQRVAMLRAFGTPGVTEAAALEDLIDDRLKMTELRRAGLSMTEDQIRLALEEFAGRANLDFDQFQQLMAQNGVDIETVRDFVRVGTSWREYIRGRFSPRAQISEADIDAALGNSGGSGTVIEVLLSEIIIAAPPPRAAQAQATAERISQLTSTSAFEAEARRHSALPTRSRGGRLPWLPISNYPAGLRALLLDLGDGQVTAPINIPNGVALFQMRGVREVPGEALSAAAIEYATFTIPGGLSPEGLREAEKIASRVDTCDDLYGVARGLPEDRLTRQVSPLADIEQDIALELAKLDANEVSYSLTRAEGQTLVFLMLCGRTQSLDVEVDREAVRNQLRSRRLAGYADALLADLRADATIQKLN